MDFWMKALGLVLGPLFPLLLASFIPRPRLCKRIAQLIGGWALMLTGLFFMSALGAFLAKRAVVDHVAKRLPVADGVATHDQGVLSQAAESIDPVIGSMLGLGGISAAVLVLCIGAIVAVRVAMEEPAG